MRTLTEQAEAVAAGRVSPTALVERALERIERTEDLTNAFTVVLPDDALERARDLERGGPSGPLHGVPVAVKDLYDISGVATSGCCAAYVDRMAYSDSAVVERLRAAGAIVVAKTNMHELAFGTTSQISCYGPVRNPWDTSRVPGGSSGGSGAAVAAGAVAMAMGSDTGGSIRLPASMCGVTGLKPTHGAVSLRGAMPMAASFDTAGPLAVSAQDCALVFGATAGPDNEYLRSSAGAQAPSRPPEESSIAMLTGWVDRAHDDVAEAVRAAAEVLAKAGYSIVEVAGPDPTGAREAITPAFTVEFAHHFRDLWTDPRVSDPLRTLMEIGRQLPGPDHVRAMEAAYELRRAMVATLAGYDALLVPAAPFAARRADEVDNFTDAISSTVFTLPVNAAGLPALAFPVGFSAEGLPLGAQLIGPAWSEQALCAMGAIYQSGTEWHLRGPRL